MAHGFRPTLAVAFTAAITFFVTFASSAHADASARIEAEGVVLTATAKFSPTHLPTRSFAPAVVAARAGFGARRPGVDTAIERMRISLGGPFVRIDTRGLAVCSPDSVAGTTTRQAWRRCGAASVATGRVTGEVDRPGLDSLTASSPLLIFNGPPAGGRPTVVAHVHTWVPRAETVVVTAPLLVSRRGLGGFSIDVEIPRFADGRGYVTSIGARIGRGWQHRGRTHSYISARCPWTMLPARGRFTYSQGTVIAGTLNTLCLPRLR